MSVSYVVYVSQAASNVGEEELAAILGESRSYNPEHDITGLLIYASGRRGRSGSFMQLLEGEVGAVEELRRRIFSDQRHHTKVVIESGDKPERDFSDWSMAFRAASPEALVAYPAFQALGEPDFVRRAETEGLSGALKFLLDFWRY